MNFDLICYQPSQWYTFALEKCYLFLYFYCSSASLLPETNLFGYVGLFSFPKHFGLYSSLPFRGFWLLLLSIALSNKSFICKCTVVFDEIAVPHQKQYKSLLLIKSESLHCKEVSGG